MTLAQGCLLFSSSGDSLQLGLGAYWPAYPSGEAAELGGVLIVVGLVFAFLGLRMKNRSFLVQRRIGGAAGLLAFVTWAFSAVAVALYFDILGRAGALVPSPVSPVTYATAGLTFVVIFVANLLSNRGMWRFGAISAFVGTVVGVMVFELPFLFLIAPQLGPRIDVSLFGEAPLFCLVFASYLLVFLSPFAVFSKYTLFSLAALFFVFSAWALLTNFSFPSDPVSFWLNSASRILGFVAAFTLFFPRARAKA